MPSVRSRTASVRAVSVRLVGVRSGREGVRVDVEDLATYRERWSRSHGGYDVAASRPARAWLRVSYGLGAPLARRGVAPSWVTGLGGLVAVAVAAVAALGGRWALLAAALVGVLALLDGIDGAVAELTGTATAWGRVLDQMIDRVGDVSMLVALWALGAPGPLCAAAAVLTVFDEAVRASAVAAGAREIGLVTVPERPTRLVLGAGTLAAAGAAPAAAATAATVGAGLWTLVALVVTVQLVVNVRRRLHGIPRHPPSEASGQGEPEDQGEHREDADGDQDGSGPPQAGAGRGPLG